MDKHDKWMIGLEEADVAIGKVEIAIASLARAIDKFESNTKELQDSTHDLLVSLLSEDKKEK